MANILDIKKMEGCVTTLHFDGFLEVQAESRVIESERATMKAVLRFLLTDKSRVEQESLDSFPS